MTQESSKKSQERCKAGLEMTLKKRGVSTLYGPPGPVWGFGDLAVFWPTCGLVRVRASKND